MVNMKEMLKAGVHFGHRTRFWNPKMAPYIYGSHQNIHIINLEKTLPLYTKAVDFLTNVVSNRGNILFVGTKRVAREIVKDNAKRLDMPYVNHRWLGGMLTNYKTVRQSIRRLKHIEEMRTDGTFEHLTKKEVLSLEREFEKLERNLAGIRDMKGVPQALFVIDIGVEHIAVKEARKLGIPVVGVVDTNNDPGDIDYIIPGNDDSFRAIQLYLNGIVDSCLKAKPAATDDYVEVVEDDTVDVSGKDKKLKLAKAEAPKKATKAKKETVEATEPKEVAADVKEAPAEVVEEKKAKTTKKATKAKADDDKAKATKTKKVAKEADKAEETKEAKKPAAKKAEKVEDEKLEASAEVQDKDSLSESDKPTQAAAE